MHTMGEGRDMLTGLGRRKDIRNLRDSHLPFNPSPEHDIGATNRSSNDSIFALHTNMKVEGEGGTNRYAKNNRGQADMLEKDAIRFMNDEANDVVDSNEDESINTEKVDKVTICSRA